MKPGDLLTLLAEFTAERMAMLARHEAGARAASGYDVNNTYQYVIAREDGHLAWLRNAIEALGGDIPPPATTRPPTPGRPSRQGLEEDAAQAKAFVEKWRERVERVTNARDRLMLRVILGETLEHGRFFAQAAAGQTDMLGRRPEGVSPQGRVLPTRWVE